MAGFPLSANDQSTITPGMTKYLVMMMMMMMMMKKEVKIYCYCCCYRSIDTNMIVLMIDFPASVGGRRVAVVVAGVVDVVVEGNLIFFPTSTVLPGAFLFEDAKSSRCRSLFFRRLCSYNLKYK